MLTKIAMTVLAGAMATAAVSGTASAQEVRVVARPPEAVVVSGPVGFRGGGYYGRHERMERERLARLEREREERLEREREDRLERERFARIARERRERERLAWFRMHHHYPYGRGYNR